jgi:hypothetical protein
VFSTHWCTEGASFLEPTARGSSIIASFSIPNLRRRSLRQEFIAAFLGSSNADSDQEDSLLVPIPEVDARHYSPPLLEDSPFYDPTEDPTSNYIERPSSPNTLEQTSEPSLSNRSPPIPPVPHIVQAMAAAPVLMPMRGERAAPTFNPKKPSELTRFFTQIEALFARSSVQDDGEKKRYVTSYLDSDVADTWEALEEFIDATRSYDEFKDRLFNLYNQVSLKYILADLDLLIGERQRLGMRTLQDLSDFHLRFNAISTYLIAEGLLSTREQSQCYLRVFDGNIISGVTMRLQIKHQNHHPSMPYAITDIYDAAKWVLQGVSSSMTVSSSTTPAVIGTQFKEEAPSTVKASKASKPQVDSPAVKTENFNALLAEFSKTILDAINKASKTSNTRPSSNSTITCNFCGGLHFNRDCEVVVEYTKAGKCRRNHEGKVVLPSGAFIPKDIVGSLLKDRFDEWHRRNPNQLATGSFFNAVLMPSSTNPKLQPLYLNRTESLNAASNYRLTTHDRIVALEAELFSLKQNRPHQVRFEDSDPAYAIRTRRQVAREQQETTDEPTNEPAPARKKGKQTVSPSVNNAVPNSSAPEQVHQPNEPIVPAVPPAEATVAPQPLHNPYHPYRGAKDATYMPPQARNLGAPPAKSPAQATSRKSDTAYRTLPPIYDSKVAADVYKRTLDTPITLTCHELLSLSPEVRSQIREATTTRRITKDQSSSNESQPTAQTGQTGHPSFVNWQDEALTAEDLMYVDDDEVPLVGQSFLMPITSNVENEAPPSFRTVATSSEQGQSKHIVVDDPFDQYYKNLGPGEDPDRLRLTVALESSALRSIVPLVDNKVRVESILDPGCQIVAMSEEVCHELALAYDPSIKIYMQSANGTVDESLGLARNVPFLVGEAIVLYIQVHVIRDPAYDILLGRPFDVLTESVVRNYRNEDQTITITDPNTGRIVTIPTVRRGPPRYRRKHPHKPHTSYDNANDSNSNEANLYRSVGFRA